MKGTTVDDQAELAAVHVEGEAKGFKSFLPSAMPGRGFNGTVSWGGDGQRLLVTMIPPRGHFPKLYFLDVAQKAPPQLLPGQGPGWSVPGMDLSPDCKKILFNFFVPPPPVAKPAKK
jgi:hypothetical protein